jgi:hypothetical protein
MAMNLLECARDSEASRWRTLDPQARCVTYESQDHLE